MKITDKKKPVDTVPKGVWEASRPVTDKQPDTSTPVSDLQGNCYPVNQQSQNPRGRATEHQASSR